MTKSGIRSILKTQIAYYQARALEYDEWFLRIGRYDHGSKSKKLWFAEVEEVKDQLKKFNPIGDILELACGTGWWTKELVKYADRLTAIDAINEVIEINKKKNPQHKIKFITEDIFRWNPTARYDAAFFSFWLSHVPVELFNQFWERVKKALKPGGRVFFIDSLKSEGLEKTYTINNPADMTSLRKLNDGNTFRIIKVFYQPQLLEKQLTSLGWKVKVKQTNRYFIYGSGRPA